MLGDMNRGLGVNLADVPPLEVLQHNVI
jgi:hypothetical protein